MKAIKILLICLLFSGTSCIGKKRLQTVNSPLVTVIKLQAAESLMDTNEAKKYIDINSVYGGKNKIDSLSPEQAWIDLISFMPNSTDKKFTRQFTYYDYDIIETINHNHAEVYFKPKNNSDIEITYYLALRNDSWIVHEIKYKPQINKD